MIKHSFILSKIHIGVFTENKIKCQKNSDNARKKYNQKN